MFTKPQKIKVNHIYTFNFNFHLMSLFQLETRQIFGKEAHRKLLFSEKKIDPSISPFIKYKFDILFTANNYSDLLNQLESLEISKEGFKAEYLVLDGDNTDYRERLNKLRDIGMRIEGLPNYKNPTIIYSICKTDDSWYFGILEKHNRDWYKHKNKPHSFSNSLSMDIAKSLVCIASKGDKSVPLLDGCCGVGTVMLEACIAGFTIEGCDISPNSTRYAAQNLSYYGYQATIHHKDIKDLLGTYDTVIIDLPYNLYSYSDDAITSNIIASAASISKRVIIVSITDISDVIHETNMRIIDFCTVEKKGKSTFKRSIWVCVKV